MIKSKKKFDAILILSFLIFILSFIAIEITIESIIELSKKFSWSELLRAIKFSFLYLIVLRLFYINSTKITVNKRLIEFKSLFNNRKYKPEEIDYYFIDSEFGSFTEYETIYLVKNKNIVERISSFDYSNYKKLKKVFESKTRKDIRINLILQLGVLLGMKIKVEY